MFYRPLDGGRSDGFHIDSTEREKALEDYYRLNQLDVESGYPKKGKDWKSQAELGGELES